MNELDKYFNNIGTAEEQKRKEEKISYFQQTLKDFFDKAQEWLNPYVEKGMMEVIRYRNFWNFNDSELGEFTTDWMRIKVNNITISLLPEKPVVAGILCSVVLWNKTKNIRRKIVYLPKNVTNIIEQTEHEELSIFDRDRLEWKLVINDPLASYEKLDKDVFLNTIARLLNGQKN